MSQISEIFMYVRMLSKSPYALKTADPSFPEETLSSSNDVFTYKTVRRNESSSPICKWMEGTNGNGTTRIKTSKSMNLLPSK